jgi:hypothetical protein
LKHSPRHRLAVATVDHALGRALTEYLPNGAHPVKIVPIIRIAISQAAFEAIAATLPFGSVGYEAEPTATGEFMIWVERIALDKLTRLRGPGESYSDVILRLVEMESRSINAHTLR